MIEASSGPCHVQHLPQIIVILQRKLPGHHVQGILVLPRHVNKLHPGISTKGSWWTVASIYASKCIYPPKKWVLPPGPIPGHAVPKNHSGGEGAEMVQIHAREQLSS